MESGLRQPLAAEFFGTFALVFAGTGAIVINGFSGGAVTHPGIACTFGLVVMALCYALGDISGCHLNPAVSVGLVAAGKFSIQHLLPWVLAQCAGAVAASLLLRLMFPDDRLLGATLPAGSAMQSFVLEFLLSWLLMFVILNVSVDMPVKRQFGGLAVGAVVGLEALFAGPVSGASMNPARSLAPALVAGHLQSLWIYLLAPMAGAVFAVLTLRLVRADVPSRVSSSE
ncbi:MAG TPA: aquaporin [Planctomycetaceae bacterium]|nr:aquaporin [Planctomycetaceae bacterium]